MIEVAVDGGKYTVILPEGGDTEFRALRYGEEWRNLCGDNLVFNLAHELHEAREKLKELEK